LYVYYVLLIFIFLITQKLTPTEPLQHYEHNAIANLRSETSQHKFDWLSDVSDGESDYSIGDVSIISEAESDHDDNIDAEDDGKDATEVDVFKIDQDGLEEVELVTQDISDPNSLAVRLFESANCDHSSETNLVVPNTDDCMQHTVQVEAGAIQESSIVRTTTNEEGTDTTSESTDGYGYVLVIDNLDMNVRRSFQRINQSTESMHICHAYALLNRFDTSGLEDRRPSSVPSYDVILPNLSDLKLVLDDFKVLVSR